MTQTQVPLPFNNKVTCRLVDFIGSGKVVDALSHYQTLPHLTYLWGAPFAGKTFLLSALYDALLVAGEKVMVVDALNVLDPDLMDYLLCSHDYLLVEDVEQLSGNKSNETALFNLYNACQSSQTKLLLTASCSQRDEQWRLPDLKSRLNSGLILSLEVLKGADALLCIRQLFERNGMPLEETVVNYLNTTQNSSLTNLYPLFMQLSMDTLKFKRKVTIPMVKQALVNIQ
ncbi:MAG: hypothetical protein KDI92_14465 [Xanthomonadales bacterium]|nr:hypothetical protein [Xanthomonadales bacterium]